MRAVMLQNLLYPQILPLCAHLTCHATTSVSLTVSSVCRSFTLQDPTVSDSPIWLNSLLACLRVQCWWVGGLLYHVKVNWLHYTIVSHTE